MSTDEKSKVEVFDGSEIFDLVRSLRPQLRLVLTVAIVAMALATALSLMHPREALHLTNSLSGHACLLVTSTGARLASDNWGVVL